MPVNLIPLFTTMPLYVIYINKIITVTIINKITIYIRSGFLDSFHHE